MIHFGEIKRNKAIKIIFWYCYIYQFIENLKRKNSYWHNRSVFQRSAFGRSTAGNDVVATFFISLFSALRFPSPLSISAVTYSHRRSARIKKLIQQKLFRTLKNLGETPFQTPSDILGHPGSHFGFCRRCGIAGGAAMQAVRLCRRCGIAGGAALQAVQAVSECPLRR